MDYCRKLGLNVIFVHLGYQGINNIWLDNEEGIQLVERYKKDILVCKENGIDLVIMHLTSKSEAPGPNEIGLNRLIEIVNYAKELGVKVDMKYSWLYGASFSASTELQTMLEGWYSTGTEVVFACGGSMCTSAFAAASANNGKVIGVDVDQAAESPTVITSAMKGLREGTMFALAKFFDNKWSEVADKNVNLGAMDNAIGLPTEEGSWRFKTWTIESYNKLFDSLKNGTVKVDADVTGHEEKTYSNVNLTWVK